MEEKMNESAAVDELAQETQKVVYGEKTFEPHIPALARRAAAEGAVLLKNEGSVLPLPAEETVAVFGRVQFDYFYVGYGSGGDVNPPLHGQPDRGTARRRGADRRGARLRLRRLEREEPARHGRVGDVAAVL